ncbi:MAG: glycosyltransferase family 4 protein [Oryzomonas sp.]|uniref:glycosyltransferase family 4 protein n=1 Tax=Oryzomonas sp. TaxID=2855186 RepID=UPI00284D39E8|nr:glycosyltransferase family 4 protein [Oryzomonas sp.]MDR3579653.1 glycosyltransferase family 4 protein [Oryzomonas sp.]
MTKIKVAIVMAWYAPYRLPLFRGLAERGDVDLTVIFCSDAEFGTLPIGEVQPFKAVFLKSRTLLKYRYRNVFGDTNTIRFPSGLFKALRDVDPQVIVAYEFRTECMLAALYSLISGCRYITWSDTIVLLENRLGNLRKIVRRALLYLSNALIGSSSDTLDFFNKAYAYPVSKTFLSILSAHIDPFAACADETSFERASDGVIRFIYVGQLIPRKGVDLLITAFAALKRDIPNICLDIVGVGRDADSLKKMTDDLGCSNEIKFKGFMEPNRLAEEFISHDIFVFPTRLDVFGLVVAEAVACGLPVICSCHAGAARDFVRGNGIIVDPEDSAEFVQAMRTLVLDAGMRAMMKQASRPIMEKHNLAAAVQGFMEAVGRAVSGPAQGISRSV